MEDISFSAFILRKENTASMLMCNKNCKNSAKLCNSMQMKMRKMWRQEF